MANDKKESEKEQYLEEVKIFNDINPAKAEELIEAKAGHIVFIGRETCSYCRKFVRMLSPLAEEHNLTVNYLHAHHQDEDGVNELREKYEVGTVPGLIYSSDSAGVIVKTDSSLKPDEILEIVEAK